MTNSRCTHKIARRSKLAWSEMVIFRLRIFALQLELCSGLWTFAPYKHLAEWRLKHTWVDEMNSDEVIVSKYLQSVWFDADPKYLIRLICVTACFTWSGSKLVLFPLALIQCWWFKMHKFLSRKVFIWLTKLHLSSGITATCSEMVICSIFGSKMDTSFERS